MEGILFGLGNPLLDLIAEVNSDFLKKYGLKATGEILAEEKQKTLFVEIVEKYKPVFVPGGATQNSIRVAQWLIREPKNATTFVGCRGKDNFGEKLEQMMKEVGVKTSYQLSKKPSGACAVCVTGKQSCSLVAYLGASKSFTVDHLDTPANLELINKAKFYYMACYVLTVCPEAMLKIGKIASDNDRICTMSIFAPYVCEAFKEPMIDMLPYVDILFFNKRGIDAFSKANDLQQKETRNLARRIARWKKENGSRSRMIVVYQGNQPTIVAKEGEITEFETNRLPDSAIKDSNGDVDAFVGGFLAQLVKGCPLECCIASGHYAANYIIQQVGVQLPEEPSFECNDHSPKVKRDRTSTAVMDRRTF